MAIGTGKGEDISVEVGGDSSSLQQSLSAGISSLSSFEMAVGAAGAAMAGLAAEGIRRSIGAASDLDAALTESTAIMGDVSSAMRGEMSDAAREVARQTTFAADEAGNAFYYLASAGMDAAQSVEAMPAVAEFAQAGMFDLETATDLATDAQSALGLAAEDAEENLENLERTTDVLVGANTLANASVEQFSEALTNKAGAALKNTNKDIEEGVGVLAAYADQGIKGRKAGERLNIVIRDLQSSAQENAGAFEDLGVSVFDAEGEMRNISDIIADVEQATAGMSTEQRNAALSTLGLSQQAADGIQPLLGQSEAIAEYEEELKNAGGTAEEGNPAENRVRSSNVRLRVGRIEFSCQNRKTRMIDRVSCEQDESNAQWVCSVTGLSLLA